MSETFERACDRLGISVQPARKDTPTDKGVVEATNAAVKTRFAQHHYDPYDVSQVFVRTRDGWITVPWTYLPMVAAPFADYTWRHARRWAAAATPRDQVTEAEAARAGRAARPRRARPGPGQREAVRICLADRRSQP